MTKLLAGPWLGEFGWELMSWVPHLRSLETDMTVVCKPGHDYLYRELTDDFEFYETHKHGDMWYPKRFPTEKPHMPKHLQKKYPDYRIYNPNKSRCVKSSRLYKPYGTINPRRAYDIVIHARSEQKYSQEIRNYRVAKFEKILKSLRQDRDISACSVGTMAMHVPGTEDRRFCPMDELADIFANSKVAVGPSSGPLHLASLCRCPHVVITYDKFEKGIGGTNRDRYTKIWNPFKTECVILDKHSWNPPVEIVESAIRSFV